MPDNTEMLEEKVYQIYEGLKDILKEPDLPPSVRGNAVQALASVWQIANDMCLIYEMTYDIGL